MLQRFRGEETLPPDSPEANLAAAWNVLEVVMTENAGTVHSTLAELRGGKERGETALERGFTNLGVQFEVLIALRAPEVVAACDGLQRAINALRQRPVSWQQPVVPRVARQPVEVEGDTKYIARAGWVVGALCSPDVQHGVVALMEVGTAPDAITGEYVHLPNMYDIAFEPAPAES